MNRALLWILAVFHCACANRDSIDPAQTASYSDHTFRLEYLYHRTSTGHYLPIPKTADPILLSVLPKLAAAEHAWEMKPKVRGLAPSPAPESYQLQFQESGDWRSVGIVYADGGFDDVKAPQATSALKEVIEGGRTAIAEYQNSRYRRARRAR